MSKCLADKKKHAEEGKKGKSLLEAVKGVVRDLKNAVDYYTCSHNCTPSKADPINAPVRQELQRESRQMQKPLTGCMSDPPSSSSMAKDAIVNTGGGGLLGGWAGAAGGLLVSPMQSQVRHCLG